MSGKEAVATTDANPGAPGSRAPAPNHHDDLSCTGKEVGSRSITANLSFGTINILSATAATCDSRVRVSKLSLRLYIH